MLVVEKNEFGSRTGIVESKYGTPNLKKALVPAGLKAIPKLVPK